MTPPALHGPNAKTHPLLQANRTPLSLDSSFGLDRNAEPLIKLELHGNIQDVPIENFISSLLPTPPAPDILLKALSGHPIKQALDQFYAATHEVDLYKPLETLINSIIKLGYESLPRKTQVTLPVAYVALGSVPVGGSKSVRKPDGVLVESAVANQYRGESLGDRSLEPAPNQASPGISSASKPVKGSKKKEVPPWAKVLVSFEVKLRSTGFTKEHIGRTSPSQYGSAQPSSYAHPQQAKRTKQASNDNNFDDNRHSKQRKVVHQDSQIAEYLAEMRSALGNRTHTFGCTIHGGYFGFWFADPIGVIRSKPLELSKSLTEFAQVIIGFATCGPEEHGFDKSFLSPQESAPVIPDNLTGWYYQVDEKHKAEILDVRDIRWGLGGRGTAVYVVQWGEKRAILKTSHPFAIREREAVLLQRAKGHVLDGVTQMYHAASKEKVSAGFRMKLVVECVEPALDRRQEVLVLELLWELNCVRHIEDYTDAFIEIIKNLHALYEKGKILHRDISSANLMIRPNSNKKPQGVINDFDLAVDLNDIPDHDHTLFHRTGTLPFLAVELLGESPPRHIFRFDLESCLYVYLWDAVHYMHGEPTKKYKINSDIVDWASAHRRRNVKTKKDLPSLLKTSPELFRDRQPFIDLVKIPLRSLQSGRTTVEEEDLHTNPDANPERWETAAGRFTFATVLETFNIIQAMYNGPHPFPRKCKDSIHCFEDPETGGPIASTYHTLGKNGCSPIYDPRCLGGKYRS